MDIATVSNATGALFFALLGLLILPGWRGQLLNSLLLASCVLSVALFASLAYYYQSEQALVSLASLRLVEALRDGAWCSFLLALLRAGRMPAAGAAVVLFLPLLAFVGIRFVGAGGDLQASSGTESTFFLCLAIAGLVLIEQLYRNTRAGHRWAIKFLCLGVGGIFAYDFYMYADALLLNRIDADLWHARAAINACAVPLVAIAAARNRQWKLELFVSRQIVFHGAALAAAGAYLTLMAATGYYIRAYGGTWGGALQVVFLFGAVLVLLLLLFSTQVRAQIKVFLGKHFFVNKYEYREEWLKFTNTLSQDAGDIHAIRERVIEAIAEIIHSRGGLLWLRDERGGYRPVSGWNLKLPAAAEEPGDSPLAVLLRHKGWVVNLDEYRRDPGHYDDILLPGWLDGIGQAWLIVPLLLGNDLLGFLVLTRPQVVLSFNWEDSDLLKTVGRQTAIHLALLETTDALSQARQFEAFNRLSAFVVHDLKNVVAQLSLIGDNASRHQDNPEFVADAFQTVGAAVARMNRMLANLRQGHVEDAGLTRVDLAGVASEVIARRSKGKPVPVITRGDGELFVWANRDKLSSVIEHLVQNAQEATSADGRIELRLKREADSVVLDIEDTGCGMDTEFIRTRLFRPFDTTKGNAGMGIGVFESREIVRGLGGEVSVDSTPGRGTTFRVRLPPAAVDQFAAP
jgi:putative PEP-CTERM system histidine kinase